MKAYLECFIAHGMFISTIASISLPVSMCVPVMVIRVPPASGPINGLKLVILGSCQEKEKYWFTL